MKPEPETLLDTEALREVVAPPKVRGGFTPILPGPIFDIMHVWKSLYDDPQLWRIADLACCYERDMLLDLDAGQSAVSTWPRSEQY